MNRSSMIMCRQPSVCGVQRHEEGSQSAIHCAASNVGQRPSAALSASVRPAAGLVRPGLPMVPVGSSDSGVTVEVSRGLPSFNVGSSMINPRDEARIRETRDRVRAAVLSSGQTWPLSPIAVGLPDDDPLLHSGHDLGIAMKLVAPGPETNRGAFCAELNLDGSVRPVAGIVKFAERNRDKVLFVSPDNAAAAAVVHDRVVVVTSLNDAIEATKNLDQVVYAPRPERAARKLLSDMKDIPDGPTKTAMMVAAVGGHHMNITGESNDTKRLVDRFQGILPDLTETEAVESLRIKSDAGLNPQRLETTPPMVRPNTIDSAVSLAGGGGYRNRPGQVSVAHRGVLVLENVGEFGPQTLDALKQPVKDGTITVGRVTTGSVTHPASVQCVTTNPNCPGECDGECRCSAASLARYARRVPAWVTAGAINIKVEKSRHMHIDNFVVGESSDTIKEQVDRARHYATERGVPSNQHLTDTQLDDCAVFDQDAAAVIDRELRTGTIHPRQVATYRKMARTLKDLNGDPTSTISEEMLTNVFRLTR